MLITSANFGLILSSPQHLIAQQRWLLTQTPALTSHQTRIIRCLDCMISSFQELDDERENNSVIFSTQSTILFEEIVDLEAVRGDQPNNESKQPSDKDF